jgi:hypothetical protein
MSQIFDTGEPWCINAAGHPQDDYPDPDIHVPAHECRTAGLVVDATSDLVGPAKTLEAYVAIPFRFGQQRGADAKDAKRLVLEFDDDQGGLPIRFSVAVGDGLRIARRIVRLVDLVDQPPVW